MGAHPFVLHLPWLPVVIIAVGAPPSGAVDARAGAQVQRIELTLLGAGAGDRCSFSCLAAPLGLAGLLGARPTLFIHPCAGSLLLFANPALGAGFDDAAALRRALAAGLAVLTLALAIVVLTISVPGRSAIVVRTCVVIIRIIVIVIVATAATEIIVKIILRVGEKLAGACCGCGGNVAATLAGSLEILPIDEAALNGCRAFGNAVFGSIAPMMASGSTGVLLVGCG
jgi:hypothetical protein